MESWIGVDLDGTLAVYGASTFRPDTIGEPVPVMLDRVKEWLKEGIKVKIFTARVSGEVADAQFARFHIQKWLEEHGIGGLEITCIKDYGMVELYDDRCVQVVMNTGELVGLP